MTCRVAIVTGGLSQEATSSRQSAARIFEKLPRDRFEPRIIVYDQGGFRFDDESDVDSSRHGCDLLRNFDCVFMTIHGTPGEDGVLQGHLDVLGVPYTNSGVAASVLSTNKFACKAYLEKKLNVSTPTALLISKGDQIDQDLVSRVVRFPCIVKPNKSGSSLGLSLAGTVNQLDEAIERAFRFDDEVLLERQVIGKEITVGVIATREHAQVFSPSEVLRDGAYHDTENKLQRGRRCHRTPALVSPESTKKVQQTALEIYRALCCHGIVRLDFILTNSALWFLEINTVPGFTDHSLVPVQLEQSTLGESAYYTMMIEDAISRHKDCKDNSAFK